MSIFFLDFFEERLASPKVVELRLQNVASPRGWARIAVCVAEAVPPASAAWHGLGSRLPVRTVPGSADFSISASWQQVLSILHHLGRWLDHFKLSAHFLNLRGLLSEAGNQRLNLAFLQGDGGLLFLDDAMFFEELIEQHRVYRFVAHRVWLVIGIIDHLIRIHFGDCLGHQPDQRCAVSRYLLLTVDGYRVQRQESSA